MSKIQEFTDDLVQSFQLETSALRGRVVRLGPALDLRLAPSRRRIRSRWCRDKLSESDAILTSGKASVCARRHEAANVRSEFRDDFSMRASCLVRGATNGH